LATSLVNSSAYVMHL